MALDCLSAIAAEVMHVDRLSAEVDRLRAALVDIAEGECAAMSGTCAPDDRCDVCTARAALEGQEVAP